MSTTQSWSGKFEKCIWCGTKFESIVRKHPMETDFGFDAYSWFNPEFLVHAQTSHGYSPDIIEMFMETLIEKYGKKTI